jgi:hypothetical protein
MNYILEAVADSLAEEPLIDELYYLFVNMEEAILEGVHPRYIRNEVRLLCEDIDDELITDVIVGSQLVCVQRATSSILPIQEAMFDDLIDQGYPPHVANEILQEGFGDVIRGIVKPLIKTEKPRRLLQGRGATVTDRAGLTPGVKPRKPKPVVSAMQGAYNPIVGR